MGEPHVLTGQVESIAAGIADRERTDSPDLLANINPTFDWVRLAQRVPVRVKLDAVPPRANWWSAGRRRSRSSRARHTARQGSQLNPRVSNALRYVTHRLSCSRPNSCRYSHE